MSEEIKKHEYLSLKRYYDTNTVKAGKRNKTCSHCGKEIPIGIPHDVHTFVYNEYFTEPTHKECTINFMKSLN